MNDVERYVNTSGHSTRVACNFLAVVWSSRIWGKCREAAEPGGRLEETRGPRAPSGLIHPGGDSPKAHAWSPPSPPSAPAARGEPKAPRTSGREPLPHLGLSVPTHPVRACQRSPPPIPEKPVSWGRTPSPLHAPPPTDSTAREKAACYSTEPWERNRGVRS